MDDGVIALTTATKVAGAKGLFGAIKRAVGGGSLFMTEYHAENAPGMVAFATKMPGHIMPITVGGGQEYRVQGGSYLCGTSAVEVSIAFQQKLGAGLFGGDGFILQRVTGDGQAWVELDGEIVTYDLAAGETLRVHPGHVGMLDSTITFDIARIKGIKNIVFGDGLFLASLTGPGRVWLQTLPLANLAQSLVPYLPKPQDTPGTE